jgi:hypothetical protein
MFLLPSAQRLQRGSSWIRISLLCVLALCLAASAAAQSLAGQGAVNGTVKDPSGAVVGGAEVTLTNPSLGITRHFKATTDGLFLFPSLTPAPGYVVTVTSPGFGTSKAVNLTVHVGEQLNVPVALSISSTENVIVSENTAPIIDTSKTEVSALIDEAQIMNLPINGRRADQLSLLSPGVVQDGTSGELSFHGVPSGNVFLQDGVDITNQWFVQNAGGTAVLSNISQDAIQEFRTEIAGYSAEFGRGAGGVVNVLTKHGTNDLHGSAFWFFRNRTLNATDLFSNHTVNGVTSSFNPPEYRHQFGGNAGGPIIRDKLFIFGAYEGTIRNFPIQSSLISSTVLDANGQMLPGVCDTNTAHPIYATASQCAAVQSYLNTFHNRTVARSLNQNDGFVRMDWQQSQNSTWIADFNLLNYTGTHVGVGAAAVTDGSGTSAVNYNVSTHVRNGRLSNTYTVNPRMVNEFRFGFNADRRFQGLPTDLLPPDNILSAVSVGPVSNLGVSPNALPNTQPTEKRFTLDDNFSQSMGKHYLKYGVSLAYLRSVESGIYRGPGAYNYGDFTSFALDLNPTPLDPTPAGTEIGKHYTNYGQSIGHPITGITIRDYDFYVQDQWQITHQLLLNLGLRYDFSTYTQPPTPTFAATDSRVGPINQPKTNFSPRVGLSYSLNDNKTVVRANYGIFYNRLPGASVTRLQQLGGTIRKSGTFAPTDALAPSLPNRIPDSAVSSISSANVNSGFARPGLSTPYVQEAEIGVDQQLQKNISLNVSYVWVRGLKFLQRSDLNIGAPSGTDTYAIEDVNGNVTNPAYSIPVYLHSAKMYQQYAQVLQIDNSGRIWYDGLIVELHQRENRFMQSSIAYTWSHAEDLTQGAASNNYYFSDDGDTLYNGAFPVLGKSGYSYEKGSSAEDQRHRLVLTSLLSVPKEMFTSKLTSETLGGWELAPVFTFATPQYVNSLLSIVHYDPLLYINSNNNITGLGNEAPGGGRVPFMPLSNLPLGRTVQLDARLTKRFPIKAGQNIELSFEAINALNHIRYTSVDQTAYTVDYNAGTIRAASTAWPNGYGHGSASGGFPDGTNARRAEVSFRYTF